MHAQCCMPSLLYPAGWTIFAGIGQKFSYSSCCMQEGVKHIVLTLGADGAAWCCLSSSLQSLQLPSHPSEQPSHGTSHHPADSASKPDGRIQASQLPLHPSDQPSHGASDCSANGKLRPDGQFQASRLPPHGPGLPRPSLPNSAGQHESLRSPSYQPQQSAQGASGHTAANRQPERSSTHGDDVTVMHIPALAANVRSLIGAGDSLNAGCIDGLLRGLEPHHALAFGVVSFAARIFP